MPFYAYIIFASMFIAAAAVVVGVTLFSARNNAQVLWMSGVGITVKHTLIHVVWGLKYVAAAWCRDGSLVFGVVRVKQFFAFWFFVLIISFLDKLTFLVPLSFIIETFSYFSKKFSNHWSHLRTTHNMVLSGSLFGNSMEYRHSQWLKRWHILNHWYKLMKKPDQKLMVSKLMK